MENPVKEKKMKEIKKNKIVYFECEECRLLYEEKAWAIKCEEWCSKNKSCNLEIIKHSIKDEKI